MRCFVNMDCTIHNISQEMGPGLKNLIQHIWSDNISKLTAKVDIEFMADL